ncbi:hypothetical protein K2173_002540 [Erythroxylum novogranatense]|uniref:ARM repeat N-terminal plant domain-containing protein n=1 Tax=Erythroxylum novogranatense TaxID=1862640 RepID=A0AAV8TS81_9ROSI|nr:hypothetical protein K2173_002540 [Erythroxylum novogranatense]
MDAQKSSHSFGGTCKRVQEEATCTSNFCFFCTMNEPDSSLRRAKITQYLRQMPSTDDQEHVLVLSGLWNIAMTHPDDPEFPSLGIFECMGKLIDRGIKDKEWLIRSQNIYIPYYAAHIIGSYTMNNSQFAEKAAGSGVILPLLELLRGKISWVEQRVAVRALGHLASHEKPFEALVEHEVQIVKSAMETTRNCLKNVYRSFSAVEDSNRLNYHRDLLTRGRGGLEKENRKAEEWAGQLQSWSLYLLNCFACKHRTANLICSKRFLKDLCGMWDVLANCTSPGGLGLIRTLCNSKNGRASIAKLKEVVESLGNISRSSSEWKYMAIESLILLLKDMDTRYKVMDIAPLFLVDLVELRNLGKIRAIGEAISQTLLQDYHKIKYGDMKLKSQNAERALKETWELKVERRKREKLMSEQELNEKKLLVGKLKKEGNNFFWSGDIEKAILNYTKALECCPLKRRKERIVLYSNRAQCYLLLNDPETVISDTTRALSLSTWVSPHIKSLWRRSQAYDMKGLAKESLMDCLMFASGSRKSKQTRKHVKIPYYAARMISKQLNATWIFAAAAMSSNKAEEKVVSSDKPETCKNMVMVKMSKIHKKKDIFIALFFVQIPPYSSKVISFYICELFFALEG